MTIYAFACRVSWAPEWGESIINASSAGLAKKLHFYSVHDAWDNCKFTDIRVRKVGAPQTSERFKHNAKYRGMPDVRCGQRVMVGKALGTIVGHNSSANFDVEFDADAVEFKGLRLNVHPMEIILVAAQGEGEAT
jgi:hypothetical protein